MTTLGVQTEIITALISLFGVLTSIILSLFISQKQLRVEIQKLERTLQAQTEGKLLDKRFIAYQSLWEILTDLNKDSLESKYNSEQICEYLSETLSHLEWWYENNGITLSKNGYGRFTKLCSFLDTQSGKHNLNNPAILAKIRKLVWELRQVLRDDLHVEPIVPRQSKTP